MTGQQSSACDVWSVGCTTIELLTGKPPYFDLQQMPALFRIVQDEHPPLPDGISPALEDFLMQCFGEDTRIMTERGFMFIHEIEALTHDERQQLRYSCYDESRGGFVFRHGRIVYPPGPKRLYEVTQPKYADSWSDLSSSISASALSIRVTGDHDLFVQLVAPDESLESSTPQPWSKYTIDELMTLEQTQPGYKIRFQTFAKNGIINEQNNNNIKNTYTNTLTLDTQEKEEVNYEHT